MSLLGFTVIFVISSDFVVRAVLELDLRATITVE
jgi:hypothetical protein